MILSGLWDLTGQAQPKFLSFLQCISWTLVIFFSLPTRKRQYMCAKSIIGNLFLISFLRAMNSFFRLEMIDIFSFMSGFNNCLWHCLTRLLCSWQIDYFMCGSCNASYIGKTFRHMKVRVSEHQWISTRAGQYLKGTLSTSMRDHMLHCNHIVAWDDF